MRFLRNQFKVQTAAPTSPLEAFSKGVSVNRRSFLVRDRQSRAGL